MRKKLVTLCTALLALLMTASPVLAGDMYRFYNKASGEHLFTASYDEGSSLSQAGWKYEGIGWVAPDTSNTPVYRLCWPDSKEHFFTASKAERDSLAARGWRNEGIGFYSDDSKAVPVYRLYNPRKKSCTHTFTASKAEYDRLLKKGWKAEGIAWYGTNAGRAGKEVEFPAPVQSAPTVSNTQSYYAETPIATTVYWTPNGERYHASSSCPTLRRSRTILSGTVSEAGGRTPCKVCYR